MEQSNGVGVEQSNGVGLAELEVLSVLKAAQRKAMWANAIARALGRTHGGLIQPMNRLLRAGLLEEHTRTAVRRQGRALKLVSITEKGQKALVESAGREFKFDGREEIPEILRRVVVAVQASGNKGYDVIQSALERKIALLQSREAVAPQASIDSYEFRLLARFSARAFYSRLGIEVSLLCELRSDAETELACRVAGRAED